jgi:hypothetical protein
MTPIDRWSVPASANFRVNIAKLSELLTKTDGT